MTNFSNCKLGDRMVSILHGKPVHGRITGVTTDRIMFMPYGSKEEFYFTYDGKYFPSGDQVLFKEEELGKTLDSRNFYLTNEDIDTNMILENDSEKLIVMIEVENNDYGEVFISNKLCDYSHFLEGAKLYGGNKQFMYYCKYQKEDRNTMIHKLNMIKEKYKNRIERNRVDVYTW